VHAAQLLQRLRGVHNGCVAVTQLLWVLHRNVTGA
jgi:hypothetical protein